MTVVLALYGTSIGSLLVPSRCKPDARRSIRVVGQVKAVNRVGEGQA